MRFYSLLFCVIVVFLIFWRVGKSTVRLQNRIDTVSSSLERKKCIWMCFYPADTLYFQYKTRAVKTYKLTKKLALPCIRSVDISRCRAARLFANCCMATWSCSLNVIMPMLMWFTLSTRVNMVPCLSFFFVAKLVKHLKAVSKIRGFEYI